MHKPPVIPIAVAPPELFRPTRRALVQWLAASAALAASGCSRPPQDRIYSYARMPEIEANGAPLYYASACLHDGYAHGVLIGTQEGRPVKVEGNPAHPASLGGTTVFSQAEVLQLWDPDRDGSVWQRDASGRALASSWAAFAAAWRAGPGRAGRPVHVLTAPFTSPTQAIQLAQLLQQHPASRWYCEQPAAADAALRGAMLAFGRPAQVVHRFDEAKLIVGLGADPFGDPAAGLRHCADWARSRSTALAAGRAPARLIALETTPGLFGARADERFALAPADIEAVLWRAAAQLVPGIPSITGGGIAELDGVAARLAVLLRRHGPRAVLCGGPGLSAESHALLHLLRQRLGGDGGAAFAIPPPHLHEGTLPAPGSLAELAQAMHAGAVGNLLVLQANPAYSAPAALQWSAAMQRVAFSVHLGTMRDETGTQCRWHLAAGHAFEDWSDARAFDGSATLVQPAIAPLYDTRSVHQLLALLLDPLGTTPADGHAIVQAHWQRTVGARGFDRFWADSLRNGVVANSAAAALRLPEARMPTLPGLVRPVGSAVAGVFPPDHSVGDGSFANNGWLQELPRPFTKITWDNALQLGPKTAQALGLASGDIARVTAERGHGVELPVWVQARHAEGAATVPCGFGRRAAGRVGSGVGVDNAALRSADAAVVALRIERIGGTYAFALTQVEQDPQGRELARELSLAQVRVPPAPKPPHPTLYEAVAQEGPAWAMAIDLDACIGCNACTIACQAENNIPVVGPDEVRRGRVMHWIRVDTWQEGDDAAARSVPQPVPCMHCENAPCEVVCPVGATVHDGEGLNLQVYNRCIGTRFCSNNCPYKVRRFNFRQYSDVQTETLKLMHNPDVTVRSRGVMEKCSYCVQRLSRARRAGQRSGVAPPGDSVETACQSACPTRAIHFGDLHDPASDVSHAKSSPRHYTMLEELNTRPRTTYLARIAPLKEVPE